MKKIICIGSATKDIFIILKKTQIKENKGSLTEKKLMSFEFGAKVYADNLVEEIGGSAVNVATGLNLGGYRSFVLARTDKSEVGKWIQKRVGKLKLKKNYMQARGADPSAISAIISDKENMDHTIIRTGDSVEWFDLEKALNKFREKVDWIYMGSLKKNSVEKIGKIVDFAKNKKAKIAFVPSSYQINKQIEGLSKYFEKFELAFMNRDEAIEILEKLKIDFKDDPKILLDGLLKAGFKKVIMTDGANGAYVADFKNCYHLGINETEKNETVGAGDAFVSGFLNTYIEKEDLEKGLAWGIANSGAVLTKIGSTKGLLKKKELKQIGNKLTKKITKIN
jgi:sugar/nucleoside kinase (ribokinase family)